jgi:hypothetical protein
MEEKHWEKVYRQMDANMDRIEEEGTVGTNDEKAFHEKRKKKAEKHRSSYGTSYGWGRGFADWGQGDLGAGDGDGGDGGGE